MFLSLRFSQAQNNLVTVCKEPEPRQGAFTYQIPINIAEEGMSLDVCKPCLRMAAQAFLWILCKEENVSKWMPQPTHE